MPRGMRISHEEKGQRSARSTNVYLPQEAVKEPAECTDCGAVYLNKRWFSSGDETVRQEKAIRKKYILCPACQRIKDHNPAGIVTLSGEYLANHGEEIRNTIKNTEAKAQGKNPLARIMAVQEEDGSLILHTTDEKLAQKLGRDTFKAHSGRLEYQWSRENNLIRVNWNRD